MKIHKLSKRNHRRMVDNILRVYSRATDNEILQGIAWYQNAHRFARHLSRMYDVPLHIVSGLIAAGSPLKSWSQNKKIVEDYLKGSRFNHTGIMADKADRIMKGDHIPRVLNGKKIVSFYENILNPYDDAPVTVDRHALRVVGSHAGKSMTPIQYETVCDAYREAAYRELLLPNQVQAITWVVQRKTKS